MTAPEFSAASLAKLESSGLDEAYARSMGVVPVATSDDLPAEFDDPKTVGLCTVPGMLFRWTNPETGEKVWQYRPDNPPIRDDGSVAKYVFPRGQYQRLGLVRAAKTKNSQMDIIVEGTLQGLAFTRYAPDDAGVYSIAGCWGYSKNQLPSGELQAVAGHNVIILLDADAGTNWQVYDAGETLAGSCKKTYGATGALFARLDANGTNGVDDVIGGLDEGNRAGMVERLIDPKNLEMKPAKRQPPGKRKSGAIGADLGSELPETHDTFLGTTWGELNVKQYRYLAEESQWYRFDAGRWSQVSPATVGSSIMRFIGEYATPIHAAKIAAKVSDAEKHKDLAFALTALYSSNKRAAVRSAAAEYDLMHISRDQFDQHPNLFAVANKVIDLDTGAVYDHHPDMLLTVGSPVEYDSEATCPRFDQFLREALPEERVPGVSGYLMRVLASAMWGRVREQIFPVLVGPGGNGKGTTVRIANAAFGEMGTTVDPRSLMITRFDKHDEEIARLRGKRLATAEEPTQGAKWNAARIKQWTGGDRLTGSFKGGHIFDFDPTHTLILASNDRPSVDVGEEAFWRRYREIPFLVDFTDDIDHDMEPWILANELPGVLNRLLEAAADYRVNGLQEPAIVTGATLEAKTASESLLEYVGEFIDTTAAANDVIPSSEMYEKVGRWWRESGVRNQLPANSGGQFVKAMRRALGWPAEQPKDTPESERNPGLAKIGGKNVRVWRGIGWKADAPGYGDSESGYRDSPPPWSPETAPKELSQANETTLVPATEIQDQATENKINGNLCSRPNDQVRDLPATEATEATEIYNNAELHRRGEQETGNDQGNKFSPHLGTVPNGNLRSLRSSVAEPAPATSPTNGAAVVLPIRPGKVKCAGCGRPIPRGTAEVNNGQCPKCHPLERTSS